VSIPLILTPWWHLLQIFEGHSPTNMNKLK
jgi:hypothetical protein